MSTQWFCDGWSAPALRSNIWGDVSGTTRYVDVSAEFAPGFFRVTGQRPGPLSGDEDEDGLPDYWEVEHFGSIANGFPETDWDLDGRTNAEELEEGTDPDDPDSYLRPTAMTWTPQGIRISWTSESDRLYDLYRTHDLVSGWPPLPLQADIPGQPSGITTYLDTDSGDSAAYYRIIGRDPNR